VSDAEVSEISDTATDEDPAGAGEAGTADTGAADDSGGVAEVGAAAKAGTADVGAADDSGGVAEVGAAADAVEAGGGERTEDSAGEGPIGFSLPAPMCRMLFVDIVLVLPSTHPVVVLQEADVPYRELRIPIGGPEGIAIGYAARQVTTPRPLTHELMTQLLERFNLSLDVVRITGLAGGTFTAELTVSGPAGQRTLDCRPSDAIALALRQRIAVPIMADPDVLDRAAGAAAGSN
jgi:hypothetical protein